MSDPLGDFAAFVAYGLLRMEGHLAEAAEFFIYDTIKVTILLAAIMFVVAIVRTFITPARIRGLLGGSREGTGNVLAALLGVPTPFCSCSAVPIFMGMMEAGVPLGVTFSFLIASPMVNEVAVALLLGLVGWQMTLLYISSGLAVAVLAGIIIGRMGLEGEVEDIASGTKAVKAKERRTWAERLSFARFETLRILRKTLPFIVLGIGLGSIIHGFVPVSFLAELAGPGQPLAVPIAVLIGIPLYSNAAGTIPIVEALMGKGMAMGTALAFMMSITALSLPEMIILRRVLKPKLIGVFALVLFICFVAVGLMFNAVG
ncbi:MAG: permease [Candidatus Micrarchaeota archaeon]